MGGVWLPIINRRSDPVPGAQKIAKKIYNIYIEIDFYDDMPWGRKKSNRS
jgi:hypothetical protein